MTEKVSLKVKVQRFGTFLSMMVMPNIPALIAWGFITSLFLTPGGWIVAIWPHSVGFTKEISNVIGPMLGYMIPLLIAYTGGKNVYGSERGGVVGAIGAMGCFVAAEVGPGIPMILGAMVVGPLGGWLQKKFDNWVQPHIKTGLEMLVNNFSAGFMGLFLAIISYKVVEPFVDFFTNIAHDGVQALINAHLIPLANLFIEPAKILFLNNAINHGILTPLGLDQAKTAGKSILFLLEANPGPGLGILIAFWLFGKGTAKATAPGAIIIQFIGGIHEIYFPYVMMKPALFLAVMAGGVSGTFMNNILNTGLVAPAAPGSIIAIFAQGSSPAAGGIMNFVKILIAVLVAAAVSFIVAAIILRRDKSMVDDTAFTEAKAGVAADKAVSKGQNTSSVATSVDFSNVKHIIFACDAGMGSSAMGASILRNKAKKAGLTQDVTNVAIANLKAGSDTIVVTQEELAPRAATMAPESIRYSVANFLNSPKYDEIINTLTGADEIIATPVSVETSNDDEIDLNQIDEVVFAHDSAHTGSSTMGKETIQAIFHNHGVKIPVSDVEFIGLGAFNASNIMIVTTQEFTDTAKSKAPNAQHLSVESLITTPEYLNMVKRMNK
ncbi:PTS transporter subunit EIIC [Lactococcus protaetiae]|uniref:PTS system mannitol-specific EIICB component n=1 Tax=Lactococcus protaetiae TaxID=2592653 RepID=A0A514Z6P7_9LACT|nr:PTS transporter subunit EIIC [Lactococcus protaetiae]MCL2114086.1 PTS transporter subunit EIIC [Streptococcaceae bacterium]QDK70264.1 PTS mannitol transporter subunit IIB [Lactococcus protaetiae]